MVHPFRNVAARQRSRFTAALASKHRNPFATIMKKTPPLIVPIEAKGLKKEYDLTPPQSRKVLTKLSRLHPKRKADGKVARVKGKFSPSYFD
jgi:hypothetical protein